MTVLPIKINHPSGGNIPVVLASAVFTPPGPHAQGSFSPIVPQRPLRPAKSPLLK
jgi:hypothetical protein